MKLHRISGQWVTLKLDDMDLMRLGMACVAAMAAARGMSLDPDALQEEDDKPLSDVETSYHQLSNELFELWHLLTMGHVFVNQQPILEAQLPTN